MLLMNVCTQERGIARGRRTHSVTNDPTDSDAVHVNGDVARLPAEYRGVWAVQVGLGGAIHYDKMRCDAAVTPPL